MDGAALDPDAVPFFEFMPLIWWGLPLAAVPLVIHLINRLRHRRVRWAAMEFLLASQRRYRTRVLLQQVLLLALRTAAVVALVAALAQPRWRHALAGLLGRKATSHVVLLDDSGSMGELGDERDPADPGGRRLSAFDRGRNVVERLGGELAAMPGRQELSVGLFSTLASGTSAEGPAWLATRQAATPAAVQRLRDELAASAATATAVGPSEAVAAAAPACTVDADEGCVLWLVSDFRARDWTRSDDLVAALRRLAAAGVGIRLVDCASDPPVGAGNLTIERLEVAGGVPATGVLVPVEVTVRNDRREMVRDVAVELREDGAGRPGVRIEEIPAGGSVSRRFEARFPAAGGHVVEARLPADTLAMDDVRRAVVDVVEAADVLLVDGDPRGGATAGDAFYLATALAPGSGAPTGLRPRIAPPRALAEGDLTSYDCIWLLDVPRLEPAEVAALEAYVKAGGGVVFFTGPRTDAAAVNSTLHRDGDGVFPVPLAGAVDLLPDADAATPDLVVEEHPAVAVLAGQRNPFLDAVRIDRSFAVESGDDAASRGVRRLLSLRSGQPLAVEKPFGAGVAVAILTTAAPTWNNWARGNPSWVVVMLELEATLAQARRRAESLEVGRPVVVRLEPGIDETEVDFLVPPGGDLVRRTATVGTDGGLEARLDLAAVPGLYEARWRRLDGTERTRAFAVNVAADEGRLERIGRRRLDATLAGIPFRHDRADGVEAAVDGAAGVPLAGPLLLVLIAILVGEQALAYVASYHPTASRRGPA